MIDETFVPVKNFEYRYKISNYGRLLSFGGRYGKRWHNMNCNKDSNGYIPCMLRNKNNIRRCRIHQLVAEHFVDNQFNNKTVNHIDGNKTNNIYTNLEWVTPIENIKHAVRTGLLDIKGSKHPNSKLKEEDVYKIKFCLNELIDKHVAKIFGMSRKQINDIRNGKNWSHVIVL